VSDPTHEFALVHNGIITNYKEIKFVLDLCQVGKVQSLVWLGVVDIFAEHGDSLSIGVGLENVTSLFEDEFDLLVSMGYSRSARSYELSPSRERPNSRVRFGTQRY
jgi:hypothetical protein